MVDLLSQPSTLILIFMPPLLMLLVGVLILWQKLKKITQDHQQLTEKLQTSKFERDTIKHEYDTLAYVLNSISFPVWRRSKGLEVFYCNQAFGRILEENQESYDNIELYSRGKELAKDAVKAEKAQIARKPIVVSGRRRLFKITEMPVEKGGTVGWARDITELEDIEHELQQHVAVQSDLMESTRSAIAIYGSDTRLRYYNQAFLELWRLGERFLGRNPLFAEVLEAQRDGSLLPEQANFREFKKNTVAMFTNLIEKHEEYYYLPDGKVLRVVIIPHDHGGLLFSYEDITDQISLERSYNTLMLVKKFTLDNLHEGVAVFGEDGRLRLHNPAWGIMWGLDELLLNSEPHIGVVLDETRIFYRMNPEAWGRYRSSVVAQTMQRIPHKERIERSDNTVLNWSCTPLPDGSTLMTYTDITDSARVEASLRAEKLALEEADTLKTRFLANASYELRSPLTSIRGFTEFMLRGYTGELTEKQHDYLTNIYDSSQNLAHFIDSILDVASIDAGFLALDKETFALYSAVEESVDHLRQTLADGEEVRLEGGEDEVGEVFADRRRIQQVTTSLVHNALRFAGREYPVVILLKRDGEMMQLSVSDNAVEHVPEELALTGGKKPNTNDDVERNTFRSDSYLGSGLNLALARRFMELHNGELSVVHDQEKGTTVIGTFPVGNS